VELQRNEGEFPERIRAFGKRIGTLGTDIEVVLADHPSRPGITNEMRDLFHRLRRKIDARMKTANNKMHAAIEKVRTVAEQTARVELTSQAKEIREMRLAVATGEESTSSLRQGLEDVRTLANRKPTLDPKVAELRKTLGDLAEREATTSQAIERQSKEKAALKAQMANLRAEIRAEIKTGVQQGCVASRDEILRRCMEQIEENGGSQTIRALEELQSRVDILAKRARGPRGDVQAICKENVQAVRTELEVGLDAAKRERAALRTQIEEMRARFGSTLKRRNGGA
jgi:predicted  nucleic acid-binding Zn-ribbon protein